MDQPEVTAQDGLAVQAVIEAAYVSAAEQALARPQDLVAAHRRDPVPA